MDPHYSSLPIRHPDHIHIAEPRMLDYWCRHFHCTAEELQTAIKAIGNCTEEVRIYLTRTRSSPVYSPSWIKFEEE